MNIITTSPPSVPPGVFEGAWSTDDRTVDLSEGWNLIGYNGTNGAGISVLDASLDWTILWNWSGGRWYAKHSEIADLFVPSLANFYQGKAYWVKVKKPSILHWENTYGIDLDRIDLNQGWNFISFPKKPYQALLQYAIDTSKMRIMWGYDNLSKQWKKVVRGSDLSHVHDLRPPEIPLK